MLAVTDDPISDADRSTLTVCEDEVTDALATVPSRWTRTVTEATDVALDAVESPWRFVPPVSVAVVTDDTVGIVASRFTSGANVPAVIEEPV